MSDYDKNTKFVVDKQFKDENIDGIEVCTNLFKLGFKKIYLFSGEPNLKSDASVPYYIVQIIEKTDIDLIKYLAGN